jgi:hypothetical protein
MRLKLELKLRFKSKVEAAQKRTEINKHCRIADSLERKLEAELIEKLELKLDTKFKEQLMIKFEQKLKQNHKFEQNDRRKQIAGF